MKKACPYCGRVHDKNYICNQQKVIKQERDRKQFEKNKCNRKFRSSSVWTDKAIAIRSRDLNLLRAVSAGGEGNTQSLHHLEYFFSTIYLAISAIVGVAKSPMQAHSCKGAIV